MGAPGRKTFRHGRLADALVEAAIARLEADGVEAELEARFANGLTGRASYTFQDAWDSDTGQTLENSPRHLAKLTFQRRGN